MWFVWLLILAASLLSLHFWWRRRFDDQRRRLAADMENFQRKQQQVTLDAKVQQQVLFNSMLEGLLLLDRHRKIHLANRAFKNLFGVKTELRGQFLNCIRMPIDSSGNVRRCQKSRGCC